MEEYDLYECRECGVVKKMKPVPYPPDPGLIYCPACEDGTIHDLIGTEPVQEIKK